jgi:hypothetical protein
VEKDKIFYLGEGKPYPIIQTLAAGKFDVSMSATGEINPADDRKPHASQTLKRLIPDLPGEHLQASKLKRILSLKNLQNVFTVF